MFRITVIVLAALLFGGCLAPEALEEQFFVLEKAEYKDPGGILTFNGTYQKKQWGIKELRGRISGEALELYGTAEFWGGEKKISHQITVPARINQVRIGSRILWERQPVKKEIVPAAETVPEEKKVVSDPAIRHLMIGGNNIGHLKVDFADFREIFWKEESSEINSLPEIKVIETADGNFKFDCLAINKDYPSLEILKMAKAAGMPLTFGSDSHAPEDVGADFDLARELAEEAGYRSILTFRNRQPVELPFS